MDIDTSNTNDKLRITMEIKEEDTDGSISDDTRRVSPINFTAITMQDEYPSRRQSNNATTVRSSNTCHRRQNRRRKVHFIDEMVDTSPNNLVTSIRCRPSTKAEDKHILYYTQKDFTYFAIEEHYYQMELVMNKTKEGVMFSWEDCIIFESIHDHTDMRSKDTIQEEDTQNGEERSMHMMHKSRSLRNIHT